MNNSKKQHPAGAPHHLGDAEGIIQRKVVRIKPELSLMRVGTRARPGDITQKIGRAHV